jgi:two-component system nitrate/nitrite response regulator NarL
MSRPWLSPRERQVLDLIAAGLTTPEIAAFLGVAPHSAAEYARRLRRKLGARNRAHIVARAYALRLLAVPLTVHSRQTGQVA